MGYPETEHRDSNLVERLMLEFPKDPREVRLIRGWICAASGIGAWISYSCVTPWWAAILWHIGITILAVLGMWMQCCNLVESTVFFLCILLLIFLAFIVIGYIEPRDNNSRATPAAQEKQSD